MNAAETRAAYRAARRAPVERSPRKRAGLSFVVGVLVGLALPIALMLAGCTTTRDGDEPAVSRSVSGKLREAEIELTDGRTVTCVVYSSGYKGGLSCDWAEPLPVGGESDEARDR